MSDAPTIYTEQLAALEEQKMQLREAQRDAWREDLKSQRKTVAAAEKTIATEEQHLHDAKAKHREAVKQEHALMRLLGERVRPVRGSASKGAGEAQDAASAQGEAASE